eukprot:TRINITY_DN37713_c0_g1_i2.p1 TRINITY_DN37713_c0_g1~~TRINITY_DN37713_c0_g1_i2.p1  ORF type:complete len:179 (-),score=50.07 TRINITY_DN37713_c0_g1_i2:22-531(-)
MALRDPDRSGAVRHLVPAWKTRGAVELRLACTVCEREDLRPSEFPEDEVAAAKQNAAALEQTGTVEQALSQRYLARCSACLESAIAAAEEEKSRAKRENLKKLGMLSLNEKENDKLQQQHVCQSCRQSLPADAFSRKMLTKPPAKRRCQECTTQALAAEEVARAKKVEK